MSSSLIKKTVITKSNKFFLMFKMLLDIYAPTQKLTKTALKLKTKPWLTKGTMVNKRNNMAVIEAL